MKKNSDNSDEGFEETCVALRPLVSRLSSFPLDIASNRVHPNYVGGNHQAHTFSWRGTPDSGSESLR